MCSTDEASVSVQQITTREPRNKRFRKPNLTLVISFEKPGDNEVFCSIGRFKISRILEFEFDVNSNYIGRFYRELDIFQFKSQAVKSEDESLFFNVDLKKENNNDLKNFLAIFLTVRHLFKLAFACSNESVFLEIFLKNVALDQSIDTWSPFSAKKVETIVNILSIFYPKQVHPRYFDETKEEDDPFCFLRFVSSIRPVCEAYTGEIFGLKTKLRTFQLHALNFLIQRESSFSLNLPSSYGFIHLPTEPPLKFSTISGAFSEKETSEFTSSPGGILADAMGLGKTIEILALILCRPRALVENNSQISNHITVSDSLKPIKATLIIAPALICCQWFAEIRKHVRFPLKVIIYKGVKNGYIDAESLADYDIVICSIQTLRTELRYTDRKIIASRFRKREILITPITEVQWWRICIDEAQLFESTHNNAYIMCSQLQAVSRWCISGTPIINSVNNLFGLISFIGIEPYCFEIWWKNALWLPYINGDTGPMTEFISKILWRSFKEDVTNELNVYQKRIESTLLNFSPLEEQMYRSNFQLSTVLMRNFKEKGCLIPSTLLSDLSLNEFKAFILPFSKLRRLITDPSSSIRKKDFYEVDHEVVNKMQEYLLNKFSHQIRSVQREMLFHLNGLAAIEWFENNLVKAAKYYLEALKYDNDLVEICKLYDIDMKMLCSDSLQKIHIYQGLLDIHKINQNIIDSIDMKLVENELNRLQTNYLEYSLEQYVKAKADLETFLQEWKKEYEINALPVLLKLFSELKERKMEAEYVSTSRNVIEKTSDKRLKSFDGHCSVITDGMTQLLQRVNNIFEAVEKCFFEPDMHYEVSPTLENSKTIENFLSCDLLKGKICGKRCLSCYLDKANRSLELLMYSHSISSKQTDEKKKHTDAHYPTSFLLVMKNLSIILFRHESTLPSAIRNGIRNVLSVIEETEALCSLISKFYKILCAYIRNLDELRMCKRRSPSTDINTASENESFLKYQTEKRIVLIRKMKYMLHLTKDSSLDCPICLRQLYSSWFVLPCVHCLCCECMASLKARSINLVCPLCRGHTSFSSSIYVIKNFKDSLSENPFDVNSVGVIGNCSTKVHRITHRVLSLRQLEPSTKILVFTYFASLIPVIYEAFKKNGINCKRFLFSSEAQGQIINEFCLSEQFDVLILPIKKCGFGLNLTVAKHIILTEPQIDISLLQQAIGRIDRIGQTGDITIHYFITANSIEEQIYARSNEVGYEWNVKSVFDLFD